MKQRNDSMKSSAPPITDTENTGKPPSLQIVTVGQHEGVVMKDQKTIATVAVVIAELVWIGRNSRGEITEILWDPNWSLFRPEHFDKLRAELPFVPFTILLRGGGPPTIVRNASELFVGKEAILIKSGDGSVVTIPLRSIQAIEMPPGLGLVTSGRPASSSTDSAAGAEHGN